jgi:transcriptional regulator with XRE-family HTH domain
METYTSKLIDDLMDSIDPLEQEKVDTKMLLAAKIADAMKAKKWKNNDLLKAVGKNNPSIVTKWLSGTHNFTVDTLIEIGHALDINLLSQVEQQETVVVHFHGSVSQKVCASASNDFMKEILNSQNDSYSNYHRALSSMKNYSNQPFAQA